MYAVIETGGKQYRVQEGDVITVEKLAVEAGDNVEFDKVLVWSDDNGMQVGSPYVAGKKVAAEVVENGKADKLVIFKYKAKKDYRRKQGHRQPYTMVEIKGLGGSSVKADSKQAEETAKVSMSMKKDELIAYANEHNIEIDEKATKQVIIDSINNAE